MNTRKNPRRNSSLLKIIPQSHLDHEMTQASKRANSSNRKTTRDFTYLSDAELEARITVAMPGHGLLARVQPVGRHRTTETTAC